MALFCLNTDLDTTGLRERICIHPPAGVHALLPRRPRRRREAPLVERRFCASTLTRGIREASSRAIARSAAET